MASVFDKEAPPPAEADEGRESFGDYSDMSPEYVQARELMLSKLYEEGAAEGIGQAMAQAPNLVSGIVDQAMALVDAMEEATQGSVPDEEAMLFVLDIVEEVVEIGQSTGLNITSRDIAEAVREVLAQVVENMGGDSTAIRQEMAQIDPNEIAGVADQLGG